MATQQGFIYEKNATEYLKRFKLSDGIIAGASHARPDLMLTVRGKEAGCELKISPTAGGSLVIKAYANKKPNWQFDNVDHDETEKIFLMDLAKQAGVLDEINRKWNTPVFNIADRTKDWEKQMLKIPLRERYATDLKMCPDIKMILPSNAMSRYYNLKNTYYINIGTHGFYLLGTKDPLNLNERMKIAGKLPVPKFEDVCRIMARVRCQSKGVTKADAAEKSKRVIGSQGYQFTFTIEFALPKNTTPYNIAPISDTSVSILESKADYTCLL
jgi:hypothetical protein